MARTTDMAPAGIAVDRPAVGGHRALVLLNARARSVVQNASRALDALESRGFEVIRPVSKTRSAIADAIRERRHDVDLVIAGGGDGTLNSALQGLMDTKLPLGLLPLGTANDLAKTLGIPNDVEAACDVIAQGYRRRIDVGRVNGVYYFNEASIGLSVTLCRQLTREAKARFGVFALFYNAIALLIKMRRFNAHVSQDGKPEQLLRTAQLTVGNSRSFGGFIQNEDGEIDDSLLDLYSIGFENGMSYLDAVFALLRHRYDEARSVHTLHGKRFEVRTSRPHRIEADGEIVTQTPAVFDVVPKAVSIFVPVPQVEAGTP